MPEYIDFSDQNTIKLKWGDIPCFGYPWHYHSEYEIIYILDSTGTRFVADHIGRFDPGELVMLAGNLPHFWRSDEKYYRGDPGLNLRRLVVQFPNDFMQYQINNHPEFAAVKKLLINSEKGIRFLPPQSENIGRMLLGLTRLKGFRQLIRFLEILQYMAQIEGYKLLASDAYKSGENTIFDERLQKIMKYLVSNYHNNITLDEVANLAGMQRNAFCRYFKEKTSMNLSAHLNELRIGFACKLLSRGDMRVMQICYETGFNNLSGFYRTFKKITGLTPRQYQKQILKGLSAI